MPSLSHRLWHTSAASLSIAVRRRVRRLRERDEWHRIVAGPAAGAEMCAPVPLQTWALEMVNGSFDSFLYEALARHRKLTGARCWDVGAHVGYHALAFASQGAQVVAFEPGDANVTRFRAHLERNPGLAPRIRLVQKALADRDGTMAFVESGDMKGGSTGSHLAEAMPPLRAAVYEHFHERTIPTVTIDTLIEKQNEPPPDIIKLDVEGAEHLVIRGGRNALARFKPLLLVEVHHICVMLEFVEALVGLGYRLEILDREHAEPSRCFVCAF